MANSVVKVTDATNDAISDSLLLLVGEDGTVTPDRQTVDKYLSKYSFWIIFCSIEHSSINFQIQNRDQQVSRLCTLINVTKRELMLLWTMLCIFQIIWMLRI